MFNENLSDILDLSVSENIRDILRSIPVSRTSQINPRIVNKFATADLGCSIDTKIIATKTPIENSQFSTNQIIIRLREPRATVRVNRSGKVTAISCEGADIKRAVKIIAMKLKKRGYPQVRVLNFQICNVTSVFTLPWGVKLNALCMQYPRCTSYEPELFPSCLFRLNDPPTTCQIFHTGKVILIGSKSVDAAVEAFEKLHVILKNFSSKQISSCCDKKVCNFSITLKRL